MISNRLPLQWSEEKKSFTPSSGGLVSAMKNLGCSGKISWYGILSDEAAIESLAGEIGESKISYHGIFVSPELYDSYYNRFSNDVLWPLFHYEHSLVRYSIKHWENYQKVNGIVAEAIARSAPRGHTVWIHDFQLLLVSAKLRELRPDLKIGFFLHIPFPSSEIFRQLPCREPILQSLLACDLVGFHDQSYLNHFRTSVRRVLGVDSEPDSIKYNDHRSHLGAFPISIDTPHFIAKLETEGFKKSLEMLQKSKGERTWIIGVDRLDYTKGLILKLHAFRKFLRLFPEWRGKIQFRQIVVPSRTDVDEYKKLKTRIDQLVGAINGEFGDITYVPVLYQFSSISEELMIALYQASDVCFVASRRDGMNLVSMEYVVSQGEHGSGIVLLSEFAGSYSTLSGAYSINPWDADGTARILQKALTAPVEERRERMADMRCFLESYTSAHWSENFISKLQASHDEAGEEAHTLSARELNSELSSSEVSHLFLDFDGTLEPIAPLPEMVELTAPVLKCLETIPSDDDHRLCIVSGRDIEFFEKEFFAKGFYPYIGAGHGASFFDRERKEWIDLVPPPGEWYETVKSILELYTLRTPGSFIEEKTHGIAWHYRNAPDEFADPLSKKLMIELEEALAQTSVSVISGKKVIEVKDAGANKGRFIDWFMKTYPSSGIPLAIGDDLTDEDMFRCVQKHHGCAIKVGEGTTVATKRLENPGAVANFLTTYAATSVN